jgi:hypothetical protein
MTHIIPLSSAIFASRLAVPLPRYAQIVEYAEPAFFGVNHPDNHEFSCREIWSHEQRIAVYRALQTAQSELEKTLEYPLLPTWMGPERHPLSIIHILKQGKLLQMGQLEIDVIQFNAAITSLPIDPAIITIVGVTFTDPTEVHVYHPGTDIEIYPSAISIIAGVLTVTIPHWRMVLLADESNPINGWGYDAADDAHYEQTVDIKREHLSLTLPSVQYVSFDCDVSSSCPTEVLEDGCVYMIDEDLGTLKVGTIGYLCLTANISMVDLYYQAGLPSLTPHIEDVLVRFAHARMPNEPCGCDWMKARWRGDQQILDQLTADREECPYGLTQGAWQAWQFAQTSKQPRTSIL